MMKALPLSDFRSLRHVLEPDDFALPGDSSEPPPSDLIDERDWYGIMALPDDVAIRTTSHDGTSVAALCELIGTWIAMSPLSDSIIGYGMADNYDAFEASLFNILHGFHKEAIAALRNALETMVFATTCAVAKDRIAWRRWTEGDEEGEFSFKRQGDRLQKLPPVDEREKVVRDQFGVSLLSDEGRGGLQAWTRNLYHRQCKFAHARGDTSNAALWNSTGPIYSASAFDISRKMFLETYAVCVLLANIGHPTLRLGKATKHILKAEKVREYVPAPYAALCDYYAAQIFAKLPRD